MKKTIVLLLLLLPFATLSQHRIITGTVKDAADGSTLPGVTILEKGTANGTTTDSKGNFSLKINESSKLLIFSFIGMRTIEVPVKESNVMHVSMEAVNTTLDEVVVIGYGAVKKSDLTGSVASVKADELKMIPVNSLDQGIQGKVTGVQVTQLSSQPGGATMVRIRGGNSIMAGNEPLYVIDGVLVESQIDLTRQ